MLSHAACLHTTGVPSTHRLSILLPLRHPHAHASELFHARTLRTDKCFALRLASQKTATTLALTRRFARRTSVAPLPRTSARPCAYSHTARPLPPLAHPPPDRPDPPVSQGPVSPAPPPPETRSAHPTPRPAPRAPSAPTLALIRPNPHLRPSVRPARFHRPRVGARAARSFPPPFSQESRPREAMGSWERAMGARECPVRHSRRAKPPHRGDCEN